MKLGNKKVATCKNKTRWLLIAKFAIACPGKPASRNLRIWVLVTRLCPRCFISEEHSTPFHHEAEVWLVWELRGPPEARD